MIEILVRVENLQKKNAYSVFFAMQFLGLEHDYPLY